MKKIFYLAVVVAGAVIALAVDPGLAAKVSNHHWRFGSATLEDSLLSAVDDVHAAVSAFSQTGDKAGARGAYHRRLTQDLDAIGNLVGEMQSACVLLGASCPPGGGATGPVNGHCMARGHVVSPAAMMQLQNYVANMTADHRDFWNECGGSYGPSCDQAALVHTTTIDGSVQQLRTACSFDWAGAAAGAGKCGAAARDQVMARNQ